MAEFANFEELIRKYGGILLDIGCGRNKQANFVGIDWQPLPGVDIVHDIEDIPWPLPDECVVTAMASHVVEHINPARGGFLKFMDEVWRVLKPGGQFAIATPYGGSPGYWQDPTHCNGCNQHTWVYFTPDHPYYRFYQPKPWRIQGDVLWVPYGNMELVLVKMTEEEADGQDIHNGAGEVGDDVPDNTSDPDG